MDIEQYLSAKDAKTHEENLNPLFLIFTSRPFASFMPFRVFADNKDL
jgi:hypothetical protein